MLRIGTLIFGAGGAIALAATLAYAQGIASLYTISATPPAAEPDSAHAVLYLVREQIARRSRLLGPEKLYLDSEPLGFLPQRSGLVVRVAAGEHALQGVSDDADFRFWVAGGERLALRLREVVDVRDDRMRSHWLLDNGDLVAQEVRKSNLPFVTLTERGRAHLLGRSQLRGLRAAHSRLLPLLATDSLVVESALYEAPLQHVNLENEFRPRAGRLVVHDRGLTFRQRKLMFDVGWNDIHALRYGGTRFTAEAPWIDVVFTAEDGRTLRVSFCDEDEASALVTYNRLYNTLSLRWNQSRLARAD